eukprot:EG_transcript_2905
MVHRPACDELLILVRPPTPPHPGRIGRLARTRSENLPGGLSIFKDAVRATCRPAGCDEHLRRFLAADECRPHPSPSSLGLSDSSSRRPSGGSSRRTSESSAAYTHDPYSFDGPAYLPSANGALFPSTVPAHPPQLSCYSPNVDLPASDLVPQYRRPGRRASAPHVLPGNPDPLLTPAAFPGFGPAAPLSPVHSPRRASSADHDEEGAESPLLELEDSEDSPEPLWCGMFAHPPVTFFCCHPKPWKRLRAKRGFTFYACRDCGVKWRLPTPGRAGHGPEG